MACSLPRRGGGGRWLVLQAPSCLFVMRKVRASGISLSVHSPFFVLYFNESSSSLGGYDATIAVYFNTQMIRNANAHSFSKQPLIPSIGFFLLLGAGASSKSLVRYRQPVSGDIHPNAAIRAPMAITSSLHNTSISGLQILCFKAFRTTPSIRTQRGIVAHDQRRVRPSMNLASRVEQALIRTRVYCIPRKDGMRTNV